MWQFTSYVRLKFAASKRVIIYVTSWPKMFHELVAKANRLVQVYIKNNIRPTYLHMYEYKCLPIFSLTFRPIRREGKKSIIKENIFHSHSWWKTASSILILRDSNLLIFFFFYCITCASIEGNDLLVDMS